MISIIHDIGYIYSKNQIFYSWIKICLHFTWKKRQILCRRVMLKSSQKYKVVRGYLWLTLVWYMTWEIRITQYGSGHNIVIHNLPPFAWHICIWWMSRISSFFINIVLIMIATNFINLSRISSVVIAFVNLYFLDFCPSNFLPYAIHFYTTKVSSSRSSTFLSDNFSYCKNPISCSILRFVLFQ